MWKPYIIKKALSEIEEGEYLFYCDSGSQFVNSLNSLMASFDAKFDIMPFELQYIEKHWTKRDCFKLLDCDESNFIESKQIIGGFSLWKKSDFSIKFVSEWLQYAQDSRILTDTDNQLELPNYEGFVSHRHDQSIFSLLIKKNNIKVYRDPSQFGSDFFDLYSESLYPQIVISTRKRNISLRNRIKKKFKSFLIVKKIYFVGRKIKNHFRENY